MIRPRSTPSGRPLLPERTSEPSAGMGPRPARVAIPRPSRGDPRPGDGDEKDEKQTKCSLPISA
jgi:hypothetical protein